MPRGRCVGWRGCAVLDVIAAVLGHSGRCEERQTAAERGFHRVGHEVVAACVGQRIVAIRTITDAGRAEIIALY